MQINDSNATQTEHGKLIRLFVLTLALSFIPLNGYSKGSESESLVQCPNKPSRKAKAQHEAGKLFSRAEKAFKEKKYTKALRRFLCSLYMIEHPATLTNIESVLNEIENKELALRILTDYVALNPEGTLTPKIKARVVELEVETGKLKEQQAPKCEAPPPPEPLCVTYPDNSLYTTQAEAFTRLSSVISIGMMGAGGASLVVGGILQGLSISKANKADTADLTVFGGISRERSDAKKLQVGAAASFAAGAVVVGIGIAQFLLTRKQTAAQKKVKANPKMIEACTSPSLKEADTSSADPGKASSQDPGKAPNDENQNPKEGDEAPKNNTDDTAKTHVIFGPGSMLLTVQF